MTSARRVGWLLCLLVGCAHTSPPPPPHIAPPQPIDLRRLADEIDPGPVEPVWPTLPQGIRESVTASLSPVTDAKERVARARERLDLFAAFAENDATRLAEGLYLAEPIALDPASPVRGEAAALLIHLYDQLWVIGAQSRLMSQMVAMTGLPDAVLKEVARAAATRDVMSCLARDAKKMLPRLRAIVLRSGGPPAALAEALGSIAGVDDDRSERARDLWARAVEEAPTVDRWLSLASASFRALDLVTGDRARGRAEASISTGAGPDPRESRRTLARVVKARAWAIEAERLSGSSSLDDQLRRSRCLTALGRTTESIALLEALAARHRDDARLVSELVLARFAAMGEQLDFQRVEGFGRDLDRAQSLHHRDGDFWSITIGLQGLRIIPLVGLLASDPARARVAAAADLAKLKTAVKGLARYRPTRAAVLSLLVAELEKALNDPGTAGDAHILAILDEVLPRATALRRKYPGTFDVERLFYAASLVARDRAAALQKIAAPLPPSSDPSTSLARAQSYVGLAARWDRSPGLVGKTLIDQIPADVDPAVVDVVRADELALEAIEQRTPEAWAKVADAYAQAAKTFSSDRINRIRNNWGYALIHSGRVAEGLKRLAAASGDRTGGWIAQLNHAAASLPSVEARLAVADRLVDEDTSAVAAYAWDAELAAQVGRAARAGASARAALKALHDSEFVARDTWGRRGAVVTGGYEIGVGLSGSSADYNLNLGVAHDLWLIDPVPLDLADLERLATAPLPKP